MVKCKSLFEEYFGNYEYKQIDLSLSRIKYALEEIHFVEESLGRIIHIAGTNGKGTTTHLLADMLLNSNYNVVEYVSPHIEHITERIVYNGKPINIEEFDDYFLKLKNIIIDLKLTYFEAITLIAFTYFSSKKIDFSIIETGLGGRYDATNVLENKIPVLTNLTYDHSDILGHSIFNIIDEKLGIIKEKNEVVFIGQNKNFIKNYIKKKLPNKNLVFVEETLDKSYNYPVPYNRNYALASRVYSYITDDIYNAPLPKLPACRFEKIGDIILDGSHTVEGLRWIITNFDVKPNVLFSMTKDRNIKKTVEAIRNVVNNIFITEIPNFYRSIDIRTIDIKGVSLIKDLKEAFNTFKIINDSAPKLVTGSFYLCAFIRRCLI